MNYLPIRVLALAPRFQAADPLPPTAPTGKNLPGSGVVTTLLGWSLYGAVAACGIAAAIAAGFTAWSKITSRPQHYERGLSAFFVALAGATLAGLAIPLVNVFYNLPNLK
jgi:hypothetical protein